jgi:hypothetical protein
MGIENAARGSSKKSGGKETRNPERVSDFPSRGHRERSALRAVSNIRSESLGRISQSRREAGAARATAQPSRGGATAESEGIRKKDARFALLAKDVRRESPRGDLSIEARSGRSRAAGAPEAERSGAEGILRSNQISSGFALHPHGPLTGCHGMRGRRSARSSCRQNNSPHRLQEAM